MMILVHVNYIIDSYKNETRKHSLTRLIHLTGLRNMININTHQQKHNQYVSERLG